MQMVWLFHDLLLGIYTPKQIEILLNTQLYGEEALVGYHQCYVAFTCRPMSKI